MWAIKKMHSDMIKIAVRDFRNRKNANRVLIRDAV